MSDLITPTLSESDIREALDIAGRMIEAGIPVFAAPPCAPGCGILTHPPAKPHFHLPKHWQKTIPAMVNLNRWEPGWALAAIGGFAADFLDVDPRSGGDDTAEGLKNAGLWPRTFGRSLTPSGGYHEIITPTGLRKGVLAEGVDLQSGIGETREGLGFVYIAPTIKPSKVTGELAPYRWWKAPDLEGLQEWRGADDTTDHVIHIMNTKRATPAVPAQRVPGPAPVDTEDPFATQDSMNRAASGGYGGERGFTPDQAKDFIRPHLLKLREAPIGSIEETANVTAAALSHFVPAFWTADAAYGLLTDALSHTAYDPTHPAASWTAEKFRGVLDGSRPPLDNWRATVRAEPPAPPPVVVETGPGEESLTTVEKLRRMMKTGPDMADSANPVPLVHGLLDMDSESWIIGASGSLKSFIALDIAGHVGAGRDWQGHRVRKSKVLYVAAEGVKGMVLRTRAWQKVHGEMEGVTFLPYPVKVKSHDGQWEALTQIAREDGYGLIIIDTQARVTVGLEENSNSEMSILTDAVSALRRAAGACVLVVHHTGRNGQDARGASSIDGAQDTELKVRRAEPRSSLRVAIEQDKQKDMGEGEGGIELRLKVVDLGTDPETERELSSLVVCGQGDVYGEAQGVDVTDSVRPWLPTFGNRDRWRRTILNALYDFAPVGVGLTEAKVREILVRDAGLPAKSSSFGDAWKSVLEQRDPAGNPVVENVGGQRYDITSLAVLEALREENGTRGEPGVGGQG